MQEFMTNVGYPVLSAMLIALIPVFVVWMKLRLNIQTVAANAQAGATANAAIQNAVSNFAGRVLMDVAMGKMTLADVKSGRATPALIAYVNETVSDSMDMLKVTPDTLTTMLEGKVGNQVAASTKIGG